MNLILASQSPRRKALLEHFGLRFTVQTAPNTEEKDGDPRQVAEQNAWAKAIPVSCLNPEALVLGADTIVVLAGEILGKPTNDEDARAMLRRLSGAWHQVITVVALARAGTVLKSVQETTDVLFRQLAADEIAGYLATGEPLDKAGAYGIQGFGGLLVKSIKGCYYNVVGLPMPALAVELRHFGIEVFGPMG